MQRLFFVVFLLAFVIGCGPRHPVTSPVSGRITFKGKPVTTGQIVFYPDRGRTAMSAIGADGHYRLTTFASGDGALLGHHRVTVEAFLAANPSNGPKTMEEETRGHALAMAATQQVRWLAPEKYSRLATSPLTADVAANGNTIDFDLKE